MATETDTGMSTGMVVGILVVLLVVVVLVVMGMGGTNNGTNNGSGNQTAPAQQDTGMEAPSMPEGDTGDEVNQEVNLPDPELNVPDEVDVNVNDGQSQ